MSLDEIRLKLANEKEKLVKQNKKTSMENKPSKKTIENQNTKLLKTKVDNISIEMNMNEVLDLITKIIQLDRHNNEVLNEKILDEFKNIPKSYFSFDETEILKRIQNSAYFKLSSENLVSYADIKINWTTLIANDPSFQFSGRKEFVKLLTNKYRNRWVTASGSPLSESSFQMLYRFEREPKAMERIMEYIMKNYFDFISEDDLVAFISHLRINLSKVYKEHLLGFTH